MLVNLRKMAEDQARIIETRDASIQQHKVEVVVFVENNVPPAVYLDETYMYRVCGPSFFARSRLTHLLRF